MFAYINYEAVLFYKQQDDSDGNAGATASVLTGENAAKPTTGELQHVGTQDRQLSTPTFTSATKLTPVRLIGVKVRVDVSVLLSIAQRQLLELLY